MWKQIIASFVGAFAANIVNLIEVGLLVKISNDIKQMMNEFKAEGKKDKYLE